MASYDGEIHAHPFLNAFSQVGGAYGIISTIFLGLYIILWNMEYGYHHRQAAMKLRSSSYKA